ncbi:MAG: hypothetical protein J0I08_14940 [Rhizobiales bacterium]|nr:hypothetical protein [Hyphomicrobiales bacterium]
MPVIEPHETHGLRDFIVFAWISTFNAVSTGAEMHMMLVASGLSVHRQLVSGAAIASRTIALARIGSRKENARA